MCRAQIRAASQACSRVRVGAYFASDQGAAVQCRRDVTSEIDDVAVPRGEAIGGEYRQLLR
jgi:hypothetical protein